MASSYGCHNRAPYRQTLEVQDGYWPEGQQRRIPKLVKISFSMAKECQYTHTELGKHDARCVGCCWRA